MPIDSNIALGVRQPEFQDPTNMLAKALQVRHLQQQGDQYQRGLDEENQLRDLTRQSGGDMNKLSSLLYGAGNYTKGMAVDKSIAETTKAKGEAAKQKYELLDAATKRSRSHLDTVTTPEEYILWHKANHADPVLGAELTARGVPVEQAYASIQQALAKPGGFEELLNKSRLGIEKFTEMNKPTYQTRNTGGTTDTLQLPGLGGAPQVVSSIKNTQSPDSIASTATARRGQDITIRGQDLDGATGSGLPILGVPAPTVTPWANQSNPKDANKVKAAQQLSGTKEVEKDNEASRAAADAAAAAKRFIELNGKVNTGGVTDKLALGRLAQGFGAEYAELESITAKLVPAMRTPGSGTTSDTDLKMFERATVGVDKPRATNTNIANGVIARSQQTQDYADFRQTYLEQNGTLQGADRYWKQYVDKNPIFDPKAKDYSLNQSRKGWRDHFSGKADAPAAAPTPAAPSDAYSDAAKEARYQAWKKANGK